MFWLLYFRKVDIYSADMHLAICTVNSEKNFGRTDFRKMALAAGAAFDSFAEFKVKLDEYSKGKQCSVCKTLGLGLGLGSNGALYSSPCI